MKKRRGNLNGELEYVRNGLAAPWTPEELERIRVQALPGLRAGPDVAGGAPFRDGKATPEEPAIAGSLSREPAAL
jgi:hypothetical protein